MADPSAYPPAQNPGYPLEQQYPPPPQAHPPPQQRGNPPQPVYEEVVTPHQPTAQRSPPQAYPQAPPPSYPAQTPPAAYPQVGQQTTQATVVVTQPVVTVNAPTFRNYPVTVTDSNGQQVQTVLEYRAGLLTWLVALVILLFTVEFGLCCLAIIPFFINDLKDIYHITPTDGKVVGVYKRLS